MKFLKNTLSKRILHSILLLGSLGISAFAEPQLESIFGYSQNQFGLVFQIASNGCTKKSDFVTEVVPNPFFKTLEIRLYRMHLDNCNQYRPNGMKISFSFKELGIFDGEKFRIDNPIKNLPRTGSL